MRLHKHARALVAALSILCVVIAVALLAQAPAAPSGPSAGQPASTGDADQFANPPATDAPTSETSEPSAPVAQDEESARASNPMAEPSSHEGSANAPATDTDSPLTDEELQRQVDAAIPHAEQPKVAPDAEYEPGVVLISVREGTTVEQLSQAIVEAGIQSVDPSGIEAVTDGLMMARLTPGAAIDDAIYELESKVDEAYGKGIVTVASAGNQTDNATPPYVNFPGDYETIVSVMNLRNTDVNDPKSVTLSDASNYNVPGETGKNISAPGTDITAPFRAPASRRRPAKAARPARQGHPSAARRSHPARASRQRPRQPSQGPTPRG